MSGQEQEIWAGCYEDNWKGFIVPAAFAHPAKFARGLITRIFSEMIKEGMLKKGDVVVDPFGGIASGGVIAAGFGLQWFGCELEEKFWKLGQENIGLHSETWRRFGDPIPVLINGDSRQLRKHLQGPIAAVVSSPPFEGSTNGTDTEFMERMEAEAEIGIMEDVPRAAKALQNPGPRAIGRKTPPQNYGDTPGQLGSMRPGSVDSVVTSPPFCDGGMGDSRVGGGLKDKAIVAASKTGGGGLTDYGSTPGQLSTLKPGTVDGVVSSPPYAESLKGDNSEQETAADSRAKRKTEGGSLGQSQRHSGYGGPANLGNLPAGDTFWHAAKEIVSECFAILKPGGYSAWVCKDFIRKKQRVEFCGDWCKLLEACGFKVVKRVRAMLVKEERHADLFGGEDHVDRTERKSFFRRIYEKKFPGNKIDYEEVIFAVRPD